MSSNVTVARDSCRNPFARTAAEEQHRKKTYSHHILKVHAFGMAPTALCAVARSAIDSRRRYSFGRVRACIY